VSNGLTFLRDVFRQRIGRNFNNLSQKFNVCLTRRGWPHATNGRWPFERSKAARNFLLSPKPQTQIRVGAGERIACTQGSTQGDCRERITENNSAQP
jgi:hypothetical protein